MFFYNLEKTEIDKKLLDAMLVFGNCPITNEKDLNAYMDLAISYWTIQRYKYSAKQSNELIPDEVKENMNERLQQIIEDYKEKKEN